MFGAAFSAERGGVVDDGVFGRRACSRANTGVCWANSRMFELGKERTGGVFIVYLVVAPALMLSLVAFLGLGWP